VRFKKITYLLIVSFTVSFLIRTTGTLFPQIFQNVYIVKLTIITNLFFNVVQALFFICFLRSYTAGRKRPLKTVCLLSIIGSFLAAVTYLKKFCLIFKLDIFSLYLINRYVDAFIPLVSSFFILLFFVSFKKVQTHEEYKILDRPISSAIIGSVIFFLLHLIVMANLFIFHKFNWLEHTHRYVGLCTLSSIVLAAVFILHFYIRFFQYQQNQELQGHT